MKNATRQHRRRPCENLRCQKIYKPEYDGQVGCSWRCNKQMRGVPPVTLHNVGRFYLEAQERG